nr:hypothetical protein [Tanacetum cinerariifolium]
MAYPPPWIQQSLNVTFDETPPPSKTSPLVDDEFDEEEAIKFTEKKNIENDIEDETLEFDKIVNIKKSKNHPLDKSNSVCFILTIEPENVNEALKDESWIVVMHEELNQFIANDVWELVPYHKSTKIIETKWVYRNKLDENSFVSRNKARLVAQCYNQQEGIDYDETYAPVASLQDSKPIKAPMSSDTKLMKDEECESVDITRVYLCARFQEDPKTSHLEAVKPIFQYIKGTTHLGLWYPKGTGIETIVYADSKHAGDYVDQKTLTRKTRKDYGMKRGHHSTSASSSFDFDHPSSFHYVDDDNDENDEGTSRASTPSPTRFVNSLSNEIPQVFSNPPDDEHTMKTLFTRQTKILNHQVQMQDEQRSRLMLIGKGIKNLWKAIWHLVLAMWFALDDRSI